MMARSTTSLSSSSDLGSAPPAPPACSYAILASEKWRARDHSSSSSHITARARRSSDSTEGKVSATLADLAGAGAGGVHHRHRGHERPVNPLVALDNVVGEEAAGPQLGMRMVIVPAQVSSLRSR